MTYGDGSTKLGSYTYEYDSLGRLIRSNEYDGSGNAVQRTEHKYDACNRLKSQAWTVDSTAYSESYTYDDPNAATGKTSGDGSLLQMTTATGATIDFSYDNLKRLNQETVKSGSTTVMTTAYAYRTVSGNRSSAQIEYRNVRNSAGTLLEGKKYTYDALGNITMISQSTGSYYPLVAYEYDAQNQLVKETYYNGNGTGSSNVTATYTCTYDTAGNILSETKTVNSTTSTKTYTYGNSQWKDLLTAVNGSSISYDASGNPTTYRNGTKTYTSLTWKNGRQLTSLTTGGKTTSYAYDADGIRTKKTVGTEAHTYVTQNGKVVRETIGTGSSAKVLDFIYDESGTPFALKYSTNGGSSFTTYYYVVNLQGDVVKLVNAGGTAYATYTYNAWGEVLTATGSMASINPLRYRGYYYDSETGFYYLQSRYYDPVTHRFINADAIASTGQGFIGTNMFAYCNNAASMLKDECGTDPSTAILTGEVWAAFTTWLSGIAAANWWNPVGWAAAAIVAAGVICVGAYYLYDWFIDENPQYVQAEEAKTPPENPDQNVTSGNPPTEKDGYIAPKGGPKRGRSKNGKIGWVDANGNIWVPAPTGSQIAHGGGHWDVQRGDGRGYSNVYPGGKVRKGKGIPPKIGAIMEIK